MKGVEGMRMLPLKMRVKVSDCVWKISGEKGKKKGPITSGWQQNCVIMFIHY